MSVLGHITVRETHGIRRFLYPLSAAIDLPETMRTQRLGLVRQDGQRVPLQLTPPHPIDDASTRLDFAISLAPLETADLALCTGQPDVKIGDPLRIAEGERFRSEQQRFAIELDRHGTVHDVVYDRVRHLRAQSLLTRNGKPAALIDTSADVADSPLAARIIALGQYGDGCKAQTRAEITACKSWLSLTHLVKEPQAGDEIVFSLPLAVTSPVLTCDFGAGGGIYGNLRGGATDEIVWRTDFSAAPAQWSLFTAGRIDYRGAAANHEEYLPQRWFHWIDSDKALAVAITHVPKDCRTMTVTLRHSGEVLVGFRLGDIVSGPATFGLCYHFLNDIPPLAAATSPQSILLPPEVDLNI